MSTSHLRARKLDRDARILQRGAGGAARRPVRAVQPRLDRIERQDWREALEFLRRSLAGSAPSDSITRKLFALIARAHQMLGEPQRPWRPAPTGLTLDPEDAELLFRKAVVRRQAAIGRRRAVLAADPGLAPARAVRQPGPGDLRPPDPSQPGRTGRRTRRPRPRPSELWAEVLAECPGDREAQSKNTFSNHESHESHEKYEEQA